MVRFLVPPLESGFWIRYHISGPHKKMLKGRKNYKANDEAKKANSGKFGIFRNETKKYETKNKKSKLRDEKSKTLENWNFPG